MIKTFEIDLDDALVENASEIFEALGIDIDTAIKMFLTQATLRQGFPFDVVIPNDEETPAGSENPEEDLHGGISEDEENALAVATESVSAEIASRVAANEALVEQMRNEIGDKNVTPEFDENEDDGTHGDYEAAPAQSEQVAPPARSEDVSVQSENAPTQPEESADEEEDEDETTPENLFDSWDVGEEEDIGCR